MSLTIESSSKVSLTKTQFLEAIRNYLSSKNIVLPVNFSVTIVTPGVSQALNNTVILEADWINP